MLLILDGEGMKDLSKEIEEEDIRKKSRVRDSLKKFLGWFVFFPFLSCFCMR